MPPGIDSSIQSTIERWSSSYPRCVVAVEQRGVARRRHVRVDLLPGLLDVVGDLLERVRRAAEPGEELGAVGLGAEQVVELETELLREVAGSRCAPGRSARPRARRAVRLRTRLSASSSGLRPGRTPRRPSAVLAGPLQPVRAGSGRRGRPRRRRCAVPPPRARRARDGRVRRRRAQPLRCAEAVSAGSSGAPRPAATSTRAFWIT